MGAVDEFLLDAYSRTVSGIGEVHPAVPGEAYRIDLSSGAIREAHLDGDKAPRPAAFASEALHFEVSASTLRAVDAGGDTLWTRPLDSELIVICDKVAKIEPGGAR